MLLLLLSPITELSNMLIDGFPFVNKSFDFFNVGNFFDFVN